MSKKKSNSIKSLCNTLDIFLASSYALYLKTQNYHWNVTGNNFLALHTLFEQQYENLTTAVDDIAERIRAIGGAAPGGFKAFLKLSIIKDSAGKKSVKQMLELLLKDHLLLQKFIKQSLLLLENYPDKVTEDMLIERLQFHEKTIWILRSLTSK